MYTTLLDTHIHLYPEYDLSRSFRCFLQNTAHYNDNATRVACLAERHDCQFFNQLAQNKVTPDGFSVTVIDDKLLQLTQDNGAYFFLLAGRQVITYENIEVLALACSSPIADQQPAAEVIDTVNQLGAIAVIAWSPGKWFTKRGQLVKQLINQMQPTDFMLGDTTLRPYGWATPRLMNLAQGKGFAVVSGSDPLPFTGEEKWLGSYFSTIETTEKLNPKEILNALKNQDSRIISCHQKGKRSHAHQLAYRLKKNADSKKC